MDAVIEQIIADFHECDLPRPTSRDVALTWLDAKVDSVIGMRRTGKSWL